MLFRSRALDSLTPMHAALARELTAPKSGVAAAPAAATEIN